MKKFLVLSILMFSFLLVGEVKAESKGVTGCYCKLGGTTEKNLLPGVTQETCAEYATKSGVTFEGQILSDCEYNVSGPEKLIESVAEENKLEVPPGLSDLNKLGNIDIPTVIGRFIKIGIGIIGTIALVMFVYGGLLWMISAGSPEKTKKSMDIMLWAALGVMVILASYAIVTFIFDLVGVK